MEIFSFQDIKWILLSALVSVAVEKVNLQRYFLPKEYPISIPPRVAVDNLWIPHVANLLGDLSSYHICFER